MAQTGKLLNEGKTKAILELPQREGLVLIRSKDRITAGDGEKFNDMEGKSVVSNRTASMIFQYLKTVGMTKFRSKNFKKKFDFFKNRNLQSLCGAERQHFLHCPTLPYDPFGICDASCGHWLIFEAQPRCARRLHLCSTET
jgi:SAICAR synthetase